MNLTEVIQTDRKMNAEGGHQPWVEVPVGRADDRGNKVGIKPFYRLGM